MIDFSHKKVVITGATRGIGKAIAEKFIAHNATIIGIYHANYEAAARMSEQYQAKGADLTLYQCDVADPDAVSKLYKELEETHGTIDVLVNNAGIRNDAIAALMSSDQWRSVIDINLGGSFYMAKGAVPLMLKQKYGRIIMITSPVAWLGIAGQTNYGAAKAGQIGLMRSLAKEVARKKITVNCVAPGFIETELIDSIDEKLRESYRKTVPMNRFGTPAEVAEAAFFLASPYASYITGAVLDITGGL
jgi:3-oxoacyl-[acyl-carrier protein] reductase